MEFGTSSSVHDSSGGVGVAVRLMAPRSAAKVLFVVPAIKDDCYDERVVNGNRPLGFRTCSLVKHCVCIPLAEY